MITLCHRNQEEVISQDQEEVFQEGREGLIGKLLLKPNRTEGIGVTGGQCVCVCVQHSNGACSKKQGKQVHRSLGGSLASKAVNTKQGGCHSRNGAKEGFGFMKKDS